MLNGGYNHTIFDSGRDHSLEDMSNVKFLDTSAQPDTQTDEHGSFHRLTFFQCETKSSTEFLLTSTLFVDR